MKFPNYVDKHQLDSLLNPHDFADYLKSHGHCPLARPIDTAILCYDRRLMHHVQNHHRVNRETAFFGTVLYVDDLAVIGDFGIGAPASAATFEFLIAMGIKNFISVGSAGGLQKTLSPGDLVVCDKAIRDEGVSYHYCAPEKFSYPSPAAVSKLSRILVERGENFQVGCSWTTDAPYRETGEEVLAYQKENVLTVEMEAAALFAVAAYRSVSMCSLLTISDSLAELRWQPHFFNERTEQGFEKLYQIALSFCRDP